MKEKTIIPVGPYHPLQEEPELFKLYCDGEIVTDIEWETGYNHRGIEKINESKTFEQVFFVVERICGICSTSHPYAYANAMEEIAQVKVPDRAKYIRTIVAELERIHSHLLWVGLAGHFIGYNTVFMWAWKYREPILDLFEIITGNRNSYAMFKIGGVRRDIEEKDYSTILKILDRVKPKAEMLMKAVIDDPVIHLRTKGVGILTKQDILDYCSVGPTARASGVDIDIRRDDPYGAYPLVNWKVIVVPEGDVFAKAVVRFLEIFESISIIEQCVEKLRKESQSQIDVKVKEIPEGNGAGRAEAPRGEVFHYVIADGSNSPARHKIRAPSYVNVATFKKSCVGQTITDATLALAAVDPCYCCTERMAHVYDSRTRQRLLDGRALIQLSQQRTQALKKNLSGKNT
ncbi:MAG: nickel-dependent hydrogenase large subunit [Bacteroides sp.]|jgi:NADH-quinone oxidoreductase subunit D|nr:nickel-dependent hydrogenase large subunit [Bacteroides sp.]